MPPGTLIRDVRATLDIDVAKAQKGLRDLEKSGEKAEKALKDQEDAARGYERQLEKTGTAASQMRRRLEAATRALPKITITTDSSDADTKLANLRETLQGLSSQKIGIDVSGTDALAEMRRVKGELEELARTEADPIVRADVQIALRELRRVEDELDKLARDSAEVKVDVDTSGALAVVGDLAETASGLGSKFDAALGVIGKAGPANVAIAAAAIAALPTVAGLAAAGIVAAVGGALAGVGLTAAAQADAVRHAWSQLGQDLRRELGDVAAPLEDSAIHAADVARETFERLKPTLGRIFKDLVPDVDAFVDAVGDGVASLGPSLERLGDEFGDLLSSLAKQMPEIMSNLSGVFDSFGDIMDDNPDMLANMIKDASELLRVGAQVLEWASELNNALTFPERGMEAAAALPETMARLNEAAAGSISALQGVRDGGNEAADGVRNLNSALEEMFDPAAKALDAEIRLKQALEEAAEAAKGKKMTELERLQSVQSLTKAISDAAKSEVELTGKTTEASRAFTDQLPKLIDLAGKNDAARAAVAGLADSLGVTIKRADDGTVAIGRTGKAVATLPNGKEIKIDANTAKAIAAIQDAQRKINSMQDKTVNVYVRTIYDNPSGQKALERKQNQPAAAGIINRYATGGIDYYAADGVQMRPQPPGIVNRPTVLYGEGSSGAGAAEAFIPYEAQFRDRAISLLGQVADDFGLELYNKRAAQTISDVGGSIVLASDQYGLHIGAAINTLESTLGQSGTLTGAITMVGGVGEDLAAGWIEGSTALGESVTGMGETMSTSVDGLTSSVDALGEAVAAAAEMTSSTADRQSRSSKGSSKSSGTGHSLKETRGSLKGGVGASAKETRGSLVEPPDVLQPGQYGVHVGGGGVDYSTSASSMLQASTLRSVPASGGVAAATAAAGSAGGGAMVSIGSFHATPDQSPYQIAQDLDWIRRGG